MSKGLLGLVVGVLVVGLVIMVATQHRSEVQLQEKTGALRRRIQELTRVSADNQRLSNMVAQAKVAQATANEQMQELLKLRAEVARLNQIRAPSNSLPETQLAQNAADQLRQFAALRTDMGQLSQDIHKLREELRQAAVGPAAASSATVAEPAPAQENAGAQSVANRRSGVADDQQSLSIRMISTQSETFAERLKRSVNAQEGETFQEVFGRFLQANGVPLDRIAGLVFDERTGRVIVRAPPALLDVIERLTQSLDRAQ